VAAGASQRLVCAGQRKIGLLTVVKVPDAPAVGGVATVAFLTQTALVHILCRVTAVASSSSRSEAEGTMTLCAADNIVQPQQRKIAQIMIEADITPPGLLRMTAITAADQKATVRINGTMAAQAFRAQCLGGKVSGVTGMAVQMSMVTTQRKTGFGRVIVVDGLPLVVAVAVLTLFPEAGGMRVIRAMAANAGTRQLVVIATAAVTTQAVLSGMHAQQRVASLFLVVEPGRLPIGRYMATAAILATVTTMHVIGGMATKTGLGH
jgi:hypothetical protein